ncbi:hypothetical protein [Devosia sp. MC1541]|uniref:hypothetical protein n=1 Tax=Devosia sp. MC1541 TaxID=2725264 RepID=UPI00145D7D4A|nr:hypothetical protein [Devosia sp. MC1541]
MSRSTKASAALAHHKRSLPIDQLKGSGASTSTNRDGQSIGLIFCAAFPITKIKRAEGDDAEHN